MIKETQKTNGNSEQPLRRCYDCIHWHMLDNGMESGQTDFSSGRCDHNGYSKCPPVFTCEGWEKRKEE